MSWLLVLLLPLATFAALAALLPPPGPPPRWRVRLAEVLERAARSLRGRRKPEPDPFDALRLQMRLGLLAAQLQALEADRHVYAKAHRITATRAAYDDLLGEACRLAGVRVDPAAPRGEAERLREEVELAARGWSW
jgi:hypothetical protein